MNVTQNYMNINICKPPYTLPGLKSSEVRNHLALFVLRLQCLSYSDTIWKVVVIYSACRKSVPDTPFQIFFTFCCLIAWNEIALNQTFSALITPATEGEGGYVFTHFCLSVCLCTGYRKKLRTDPDVTWWRGLVCDKDELIRCW